jgi:hypothetical protein
MGWNLTSKANPSMGGTFKNITSWFSWTHQFFLNHKKHFNKYFNFLISKFIRFYRFWNFNNIKNILYFDVLNHCIYKKFQNYNIGSFAWTFLIMNKNLKHNLRSFLGININNNLEIILLLGFYYPINWINII